ncbi:MAG: class I SAM-dependent methyltransferase [Thermoanaerobaculia bacterium]
MTRPQRRMRAYAEEFPRPIESHSMMPRHQSRRDQSDNWDNVAAAMPDFYEAPSTQYYRQCEISLLEREIGDLTGKRVLKLDLWNEAINTRILHWVDARAASTFGMDLSHVVVSRANRKAREYGTDVRVARADIRDVPFRSNCFDVVYTMGTIEHVAEYEHAIEEIYRVLKPGGRAVIGVPRRYDIFLRPILVAILEWLGRYPYAPEKSFSASALRRSIEKSGLKVRRTTGILIIPGILRMLDLLLHTRRLPFAGVTRPFIRLCEILETRYPASTHLGYLLTMIADKPSAR